MPLSTVGALVLAGGKGTRMHSDTPKVLKCLLEEPMLRYVHEAVSALCGERVWTIVGHEAELVKKTFPACAGRAVLQERQLGTGHALQTAWPHLAGAGLSHVLVVNGDTPQLSAEALSGFLAECLKHGGPDIGLMTAEPQGPNTFGRVLRTKGQVRAIVEAKDFTPDIHGPLPREINLGIYCLRLGAVAPLLSRLGNNNKSNEYYITDLIGFGVESGLVVQGFSAGNDSRLLGVNTPQELIFAEEEARSRIVNEFLAAGVIIRQPDSVRIGPHVRIAPGVELTGPCELYGATVIGAGVRVDSHCKMVNTVVGKGTVVQSFSLFVDAVVGENCTAGPFSRLRPGALLEADAHIGNFVEVKKSRIGQGAKVNHLTYIGDAEIGPGANIGAGTITCNYDGKNKHLTRIGAGVFIGSNSALVAPVTIGDGALIGAGSVITKDVPDGDLAVARGRQTNLPRKKKGP